MRSLKTYYEETPCSQVASVALEWLLLRREHYIGVSFGDQWRGRGTVTLWSARTYWQAKRSVGWHVCLCFETFAFAGRSKKVVSVVRLLSLPLLPTRVLLSLISGMAG